MKTPLGKIPAIKPQTPESRSEYCRKFLYLSGFLTEAQNEKVRRKIEKFAASRKNRVK